MDTTDKILTWLKKESDIADNNKKKLYEHFGEETILKLPKTIYVFPRIDKNGVFDTEHILINLETGNINNYTRLGSRSGINITDWVIKKLEEEIIKLFENE